MEGNVLQVVVHRMAKEKMLNVQEKGGKKNRYHAIQPREKKSKKIEQG